MTEKYSELDKDRVQDSQPGNVLTTNTGVRIQHTDDSLKAGERGPTLLEDFHLREKLLILIMKEFLNESFMLVVLVCEYQKCLNINKIRDLKLLFLLHSSFQMEEKNGGKTKIISLLYPQLKKTQKIQFYYQFI